MHNGDSMFGSTQELLDFIENAKKAKVKAFKIGEISVEFSDLAFLDTVEISAEMARAVDRQALDERALSEKEQLDEDEELLFHSST
jgi:hypothetical protein